ncbi:hypothetical protein H8K20_08155 [Neobittarella massiliensis]|uniref:Uncharacterized protein n=1 Tax=Neobittarella massiliensis (ex Bilen et al. 2018) TaxID=2041842 RepID=A0A8J6IPE6_9FIRM|nr:hypothetical protein [Neobittarella massiliensis]MBC3516367.1 hypothetical protein [Neobittarella massiliensis]
MSGQTEYFGLHKPDPEDFYDIGRQNANADTMDAALQRVRQTAEAAIPAAQKGQPGGVAATEHQHRRADISDFPTALPADGGNAATVGGKTAGEFAAAVHTHQRAGITDFAHTHPKSQITDFPAAIKNPYALTIQVNGVPQTTYTGASAQSFNITPEKIGAMATSAISSGSNANGRWIKFPGGFMIVFQTVTFQNVRCDHQWGNIFTSANDIRNMPNFPLAFSAPPVITRSLSPMGTGDCWLMTKDTNPVVDYRVTSGGFQIARGSHSDYITVTLSVIAMGPY